MISNPKIAGSQEIFLVAQDNKEVDEIYGLNSSGARQTVRSRQSQIKDSGHLHFKELQDVKQERYMNAVNSGANAIKGRGRG